VALNTGRPRFFGTSVATVTAALWLIGGLAFLSGCRERRYVEPDVEVVRQAIGCIASGVGCSYTVLSFKPGGVRCFNNRYEDTAAPTIVVASDGEVLSLRNLPAGFSEDEYAFWITRENAKRTWVYEKVSNHTFIVENHKIARFFSGGGPVGSNRPWTRVRPVGGIRSWMLDTLLIVIWVGGICFVLWLMWGFLSGSARTIRLTAGVLRVKRKSSSGPQETNPGDAEGSTTAVVSKK